jgi:hypothetical protein
MLIGQGDVGEDGEAVKGDRLPHAEKPEVEISVLAVKEARRQMS